MKLASYAGWGGDTMTVRFHLIPMLPGHWLLTLDREACILQISEYSALEVTQG